MNKIHCYYSNYSWKQKLATVFSIRLILLENGLISSSLHYILHVHAYKQIHEPVNLGALRDSKSSALASGLTFQSTERKFGKYFSSDLYLEWRLVHFIDKWHNMLIEQRAVISSLPVTWPYLLHDDDDVIFE